MRSIFATVLVIAQLFWVNFPREWVVRHLESQRPPLPVVQLPAQRLVLGVYDPLATFRGAEGVGIEQVFAPWRPDTTRQVVSLIREVRSRERTPLVSLEPWPFNVNGMTRETLFDDVLAGKYDAPVRMVCNAAAAEAPQEILLRWGHEMDLTGHHPWAQGKPEQFASAYRHVVDVCRATGASNVRFVWSPAGNWNAPEYWPGAEYVDFVGVTALGFRDWEIYRGETSVATFQELFERRLEAIGQFDKPIIICEFGVQGDRQYQSQWIEEAFKVMPRYPQLRAVVYFNAVDPYMWGDFEIPDWRISPDQFLLSPFAPAPASRPQEAPQST